MHKRKYQVSAGHINTMYDLWDASKRLLPGFCLGHVWSRGSEEQQDTHSYQGFADVASCRQWFEVAAVVDKLNFWDLDGLQLLLCLTIYNMQLLHAVQKHCCPGVYPLEREQTADFSNAHTIRGQMNRFWPFPQVSRLEVLAWLGALLLYTVTSQQHPRVTAKAKTARLLLEYQL